MKRAFLFLLITVFATSAVLPTRIVICTGGEHGSGEAEKERAEPACCCHASHPVGEDEPESESISPGCHAANHYLQVDSTHPRNCSCCVILDNDRADSKAVDTLDKPIVAAFIAALALEPARFVAEHDWVVPTPARRDRYDEIPSERRLPLLL